MKTKNPTLYDLPALDFHRDNEGDGAPRVLALLPDDGGRVILVFHGGGSVLVRSIAYDDSEALKAAGAAALEGHRFEPFTVNGIPYRFSYQPEDGPGLPYLHTDRLDSSFDSGTDSACSKLRALSADVLAFVRGFRPGLETLAEAAHLRRALTSNEGKLAELAGKVNQELGERERLGQELRAISEEPAEAETFARLSFEEGRAVLLE